MEHDYETLLNYQNQFRMSYTVQLRTTSDQICVSKQDTISSSRKMYI